MRILKISAGLAPKRAGGVPAYVQELRDELVSRGHKIIFLDTLNTDGSRKVRITQTRTSPSEFSFYNSGASLPWGEYLGTPRSDIHASKQTEKCFLDFVAEQDPDVIHFHELLCFPMELVSRLRSCGHKLLFTTHDYFSICPTIKLLLPNLETCTLQGERLRCDSCVRRSAGAFVSPFYHRNRRRLERFPRFFSSLARRLDKLCGRVAMPWVHSLRAHQTRRREALRHLRAFHLILCISRAQRELMERITGPLPNVREIYLSRKTYGHGCRVAACSRHDSVFRFVALNVNDASKGRDLLLREFAELRGETKGVELHVFGGQAVDQTGVVYHPNYVPGDLEVISAEMDVGVMPSIWAETYGYVGPELLTRGVPLIVSSAGAMKEYVTVGFNGLIFNQKEPGSLRARMRQLWADKNLLLKLKSNASSSKKGLTSFYQHVDMMEGIYREFDRGNATQSLG